MNQSATTFYEVLRESLDPTPRLQIRDGRYCRVVRGEVVAVFASEDPCDVHRRVAGMDVMIENPVGSVRSGKSKSGREWAVTMHHDYGYLRKINGADGEGLDIFIGPEPDDAANVYVVHQNNPDTGDYDEDKVMFGFADEAAAKSGYLANYDRPDFFRSMTSVPLATFKKMVSGTVPAGAKWKHKPKGAMAALFASEDANHNLHASKGGEGGRKGGQFVSKSGSSDGPKPRKSIFDDEKYKPYKRTINGIEVPVHPKLQDAMFDSAVKELAAHAFKHERNEIIPVGDTPSVLRKTGASDLPLTMTPSIVEKGVAEHGIPVNTLAALPTHLREPIAVFRSKSKDNSLVVLTGLRAPDGRFLVAAVHHDVKHGRTAVNAIATVHPKQTGAAIEEWVKDGLLLYWDKKKGQQWSQSAGRQLPGEWTTAGPNRIIDTPESVRKWEIENNVKTFSADNCVNFESDWMHSSHTQGHLHWVTIGAKEGPDGKRHGGVPVQIGGDGKIEKGPAKMTGKTVGELKSGTTKPPEKKSRPSLDEIMKPVRGTDKPKPADDPEHTKRMEPLDRMTGSEVRKVAEKAGIEGHASAGMGVLHERLHEHERATPGAVSKHLGAVESDRPDKPVLIKGPAAYEVKMPDGTVEGFAMRQQAIEHAQKHGGTGEVEKGPSKKPDPMAAIKAIGGQKPVAAKAENPITQDNDPAIDSSILENAPQGPLPSHEEVYTKLASRFGDNGVLDEKAMKKAEGTYFPSSVIANRMGIPQSRVDELEKAGVVTKDGHFFKLNRPAGMASDVKHGAVKDPGAAEFTKSGLVKTLTDRYLAENPVHNELQYTEHEAEVMGRANPTTFYKKNGKAPADVLEELAARGIPTTAVKWTDDPSQAGGADAAGELGDKYWDIIESQHGSPTRRAIEYAHKKGGEDAWLAALHDSYPENAAALKAKATRLEKQGKGKLADQLRQKAAETVRAPQEMTSTAELKPGDEFDVNGIPVRIEEVDEGELVAKDHGALPDTPVEQLPEKIPVDKGTRVNKGPDESAIGDDPFGDLPPADDAAGEDGGGNEPPDENVTAPGEPEDENEGTPKDLPEETAPEAEQPAKEAVEVPQDDIPSVDNNRQLGMFEKDAAGQPVEIGQRAGQGDLFGRAKPVAPSPVAAPQSEQVGSAAANDPKNTAEMFPAKRDDEPVSVLPGKPAPAGEAIPPKPSEVTSNPNASRESFVKAKVKAARDTAKWIDPKGRPAYLEKVASDAGKEFDEGGASPMSEDTYVNGDKGRLTGKTQTVHGAEFQEVEMLEGADKGKTKLVKSDADRDKQTAQKQAEWKDQQAQFARLRESGASDQMPKATSEEAIKDRPDNGTKDSTTLPEHVSPHELAKLDAKIARHAAVMDRTKPIWNKPNEIPGPMATGRDNYSMGKKLDAENNRKADAYREHQTAEAEHRRLSSHREGYLAGRIHPNGQPRVPGAVEARAAAKERTAAKAAEKGFDTRKIHSDLSMDGKSKLTDGREVSYEMNFDGPDGGYRYKVTKPDGSTELGKYHPSISKMQAGGELKNLLADKSNNAKPTMADIQARAKEQVAETKAAEPTSHVDQHRDFMQRLYDGKVTPDEFRANHQRIVDNADAIKAGLSKKTKAELSKMTSGYVRDDSKPGLVKNVYDRMLDDHVLGDSYSYGMSSGNSRQDAIAKKVAEVTPEHIEKFAKNVAEGRAERKARIEKVQAAVADPKTLEEFQLHSRVKGEAALTPEQLDRYDELRAASGREQRQQDAEKRAIVTKANLGGINMTLKEGWHSKHNIPLHTVQMDQKVDADTFRDLTQKARQLGGNYSSFGKREDRGFQFKDKAAAEKFMQLKEGDVSTAEELKQRQAETTGSAADRMQAIASRMETSANDTLNADRKTNTARRASMASNTEANARKDIATANTLRNISTALSDGKAKNLAGIRHRTQIEGMDSLLHRAKWDAVKLDEKAAEAAGERHVPAHEAVQRPSKAEDIQHVKYPHPRMYHSTLRSIMTHVEGKPGGMLLANRLRKRMTADAKAGRDYSDFRGDGMDDLRDLTSKAAARGATKWDLEAAKRQLLEHDRLHAAGITNLPELRAALREYLPMKGKAEAEDPVKKMERGLVGNKIAGFFPTPRPVIDRMLDAADIQPGHKVLEPSAGKGDILDAINERHPDAESDAIEPHSSLREILKAKGHKLAGEDILQHAGEYDRVVMNPPFENGQDREHVRKAYELLKPGGKLVAVMAGGSTWSSDQKKPAEFREWVDSVSGEVEDLPANSFGGDDAFRQTGVNTKMVVIHKPDTSTAQYASEFFYNLQLAGA